MSRHILSLLILVLLSISCSDDMTQRDSIITDSEKIVLPFSIDKTFNTRSENGERPFDEKIDHIYLAFYPQESGNISGLPVAVAKGVVENSNKLTFYLPSELQQGIDYKLLAIANADYFNPDTTKDFEAYLKSTNYSELRLYNSACIISTSLSGVPMQATDGTFSFTKTASGYSVTKQESLLFYRMVARADVKNSAPEMEIQGIAMCNWRDAVNFGETMGSQGSIKGKVVDENISFIDVAVKDESGFQSLDGVLYCFPSAVETSEKGDEFTTALIIKAKYNNDENYCYYRVNLGVNGDRSELKQNTRYSLNIKEVKGKGFPTAKAAYEATTDPYTETTFEPEIPENLEFALLPLIGDRVKVDHDKKTIEIDGFDPECFNSFIDIPFRVYAKDKNIKSISISTGDINGNYKLKWPLEGRISKKTSSDYCYCPNSFVNGASTTVYSKSQKVEEKFNMYSSCYAYDGETIYISVGAMAPDDPSIKAIVWVGDDCDHVEYTLVIKPRDVIIDDVVLKDENGKSWLILDRNVQDESNFGSYIGRYDNGKKRQAYNYLKSYFVNSTPTLYIPGKYYESNSKFDESMHRLYLGKACSFNSINSFQSSVTSWLNKYVYKDGEIRNSPFYETDNINKWIYPNKSLAELCIKKMSVSKMRMYLMSDVPAKNGSEYIHVCCYWPFYNDWGDNNLSTDTYGYVVSGLTNNPESIILIYCENTEVNISTPSSLSGYSGLSRLVRPLTQDELENYKKGYLGYGGTNSLKLTKCHPDTYASEPLGWIPN